MDPHVPGVEQTLNSSTQALGPCRAVRHRQTRTNLVPAGWGHPVTVLVQEQGIPLLILEQISVLVKLFISFKQ